MADLLTLGASVGMGILSGITGASSQNEARRLEEKRINQQYKYDKRLDRYNWQQTRRDYRYRTRDVQNQRENNESNLRYLEETARRNYQYDLQIRDFDYKNQLRQYKESERIYGLQRGANAQAAALARQSEENRYNEIMKGMAFEQQDMLVKMLQEEGQSIARGVSGRSASKQIASVIAGYGRNQAILEESVLSAGRDTAMAMRQIEQERYQADLNADSRRMLQPLKAPAPMAPLAMPRPNLLDPMQPKRGPRPIKGVNTVQGASGFSVAANVINTGLNAYTMFGGKFT
jgi:hypothetical protein